MNCDHGVNLKHQRCYCCESIAEAEGKAKGRIDKKQRRDLDRHIEREQLDDFVDEDHGIPEIDPNNLEKQWVEQPKLAERFSDLLADAKHSLAVAEQEREETTAKVKLDIRKKPDEYGIDKVTEVSVQETLANSQEYKDACSKVIEAKYLVDKLGGKLASVGHRKTGLENAVQLWLASYFSTPRLSGEDGERMREVKKRDVRRKGR